MALAIVFPVLILSLGLFVQKLLRLPRGPETIGFAAPIGLATFALATSWLALLGFSLWIGACLLVVGAFAGLLVSLPRLREDLLRLHESPDALAGTGLLLAALVLSWLVLSVAFQGIEVP